MAEVLLSAVAEGILSELFSLVAEEVTLISGFKAKLGEMGDKLEMIKALLSDAGSQRKNSVVQLWLQKLKFAASDAEDLLDEIAYEALRRKVEINKKVLDFFSTHLFRVKMSHKIKKVNSMFDAIYLQATVMGLRPIEVINNAPELGEIRLTHPFVDESEVLGRNIDISTIVDDLISPDGVKDLSVSVIVGMGGQGKTTLAKLVYHNDEVITHFDCRIWVCVSDDFNLKKLLNEMLQCVTKANLNMSNVEAMIKKLQESVSGKKLLLVLDDVWNENESVWESVKSSLLGMGGSNGSKVLVTTRSTKVALCMHASFTHHLASLSDADSWNVFKRRAFAEGGAKETPNLVGIGKMILRRCGGVPLAIKALGGLMHSKKDEREWLSIQDGEIWDTKDENGVMATLRLSYDHLPSLQLKQCFAFCSIFLKDSVIGKDNLIQLWMAQGFLQPPKGSHLLMEDIGSNYFNIFLWNSLLQDVVKDDYDNTKTCKMHDLVHDLAVDVSKNNCLNLFDNKMNGISEIQHLSCNFVEENTHTPRKESVNRLHTLLFFGIRNLTNNKSLLALSLITNSKYLRALSLHNLNIEEWPDLISKLKYLRYLKVSFTYIQKLPDSVTKLYSLQTLKLIDCPSMKDLPNSFENLINLRHFDIRGTWGLIDCPIIGIGQLTCLQTLPFFIVSRERGCEIQDLKRLNNLRGELKIFGLEGVRDKEEAREANLLRKPNVHSLELHWRDQRTEACNDEQVLEGLEPHWNLKELTIEDFNGQRFAPWMMMAPQIPLSNLENIRLINCGRCEVIPALGQLPYLKVVEISGLDKVRSIGREFYGDVGIPKAAIIFPALKKFTLINMESLVEWSEVVLDMVAFPCLEKLIISGCPNLISAPSHFPSVKDLTIIKMNSSLAITEMSKKLTSLTSLKIEEVGVVNFVLKKLLENNQSLQELVISKCHDITSFPEGMKNSFSLEKLVVEECANLTGIPDIQNLSCLEYMEIMDCPSLKFGCHHHQILPRLKSLKIGKFSNELDYFPWPWPENQLLVQNIEILQMEGWSKLKCLPPQLQNLTSALKHMQISEFNGLEVMPEWFGNLFSLQSLELSNCKRLVNLPSVEAMRRLTNLNELDIYKCPLLMKRCSRERGEEWQKIAHIRTIVIK